MPPVRRRAGELAGSVHGDEGARPADDRPRSTEPPSQKRADRFTVTDPMPESQVKVRVPRNTPGRNCTMTRSVVLVPVGRPGMLLVKVPGTPSKLCGVGEMGLEPVRRLGGGGEQHPRGQRRNQSQP